MESKEIEAQIKQTNKQINDLRGKKADLLRQLKEAKQVEFEAQHGVKSGDRIQTKKGEAYYYDSFGINAYGYVVIFCHPVKNDGTPSKAVRHLSESDFSAI